MADEQEKTIIGYDLGNTSPAELPCDPTEIVLVEAGGGAGAGITTLDVWGLDPKLMIVFSFYRSTRDGSIDRQNITAAITAHVLAKGASGPEIMAPIPSDLFLNGGAINASGEDGCSISDGAQGVRFTFSVTKTGATGHALVAAIQAKTNSAFGCCALLEKQIGNVKVGRPKALRIG